MPSLAWFLPCFQGLMFGVLAMTLHELGHLLAAMAVGVRVKMIGLRWKGVYMVREAGPAQKNLLISLAGPLTNFALLLCWPLSEKFFLANLCFAFFNLLPIEGSDGDRILRCWAQMKREGWTAPAFLGGRRPSLATLVSTSKHGEAVTQVPQSATEFPL